VRIPKPEAGGGGLDGHHGDAIGEYLLVRKTLIDEVRY
jgi:hypothetical protein